MSRHVQYGCGLSAPDKWKNYDSSPTLKIQRMPLVGSLVKSRLNVVFPDAVMYGDIVTGLPEEANSCDGVYCSHILEHLSLDDFRKALKNTYVILKTGGIFRCVVPDLEVLARNYVNELDRNDNTASLKFIEGSLLGLKQRPRGFKSVVASVFGNSHHLWMWDSRSLSEELKAAGFRNVRPCKFNDSPDKMFSLVESEDRFHYAVALECSK